MNRELVWQVRDVKHNKVLSFYSQQDFEEFMIKFLFPEVPLSIKDMRGANYTQVIKDMFPNIFSKESN